MRASDVVVITNPAARAAPARVVDAVGAIWRSLGTIEQWRTERQGHATELARRAAEAGAGVVVAVGGDGTANEVANGLAGSESALAVVPGGSTNVFARALGLPRDPLAATRKLVAAAKAGQRLAIGAGRLDGRLFLANAGAGFDAAVLADVEAHPRLKRILGPAWFVAATARLSMHPGRRSADAIRVRTEGHEQVAEFVALLHTGPYSYLGRRRLLLTDGPPLRAGLALVMMDHLGPRELVSRLPRALGRGLDRTAQRARTGVWVRQGVDSVRLDRHQPGPLVYQVDGEVAVAPDGLVLGYEPDALFVVTPNGTGEHRPVDR